MKIERFEEIEAWQLARELAIKVYRLTSVHPQMAIFVLLGVLVYCSQVNYLN